MSTCRPLLHNHRAHPAPPTPPAAPPRVTWISLADAGLRVAAAVLNFLAAFGGHP